MNILVFAGLRGREHTLTYKIAPLFELKTIHKVFIIRPDNYANKKTTCIYPQSLLWKKNIFFELFRIYHALKTIIQHKPKLIIGIGLIPHGLSALILSKLTFRKCLILLMGKNDLHLTYPNRKFTQNLLTYCASKADIVGTKGTNSKRYMENNGMLPNKVFIPHHVFDFHNFYPEKKEKVYSLVYVGYINYYKRIDLMLEVVNLLVHEYQHHDLRTAIVGNGNLLNEMKIRAKKLNIENNVTFIPPGNREFIRNIFNQSQIFVMTSQGEGLPNVLIEAMSCSLPAVIFDDADISDIAKDNYNSFLIPLHNTQLFAQKVHTLLSDKNLLHTFSSNAEKIKLEKEYDFSMENLKMVWQNALNEL